MTFVHLNNIEFVHPNDRVYVSSSFGYAACQFPLRLIPVPLAELTMDPNEVTCPDCARRLAIVCRLSLGPLAVSRA